MKDKKKRTLCLDCFMLELEEERKLAIMRKPRNDTKKLNPKLGMCFFVCYDN
jgi:hypothetical protein